MRVPVSLYLCLFIIHLLVYSCASGYEVAFTIVFFFFFDALYHMEVPGPEINLNLVVTYATAVAMLDPLTHCAGPGIKPSFWCCRDATDPLRTQWELQVLL